MFRYLRTQAQELQANLSKAMLNHGSYSFSPSTLDIDLLPKQAPPRVHRALDDVKETLIAASAITATA